jgi:Flp pilus assembly protein TadB
VNPLFAALFAAVAVVLVRPMSARSDLSGGRSGPVRSTKRGERSVLVRLRVLLCALSVVAGWALVGGPVGMFIGVVGAGFAWRALARMESPATIRRRQELEADLPTAVHLLGACLAAGAATTSALSAVSAAMPGAVGEELALVHRRLHWGVDPASVWRSIDGPLQPLGRSMARAHESGASVRQAVNRLAEELRAAARSRAESRARTIEVRAAAPLGLCFLPAFVLLGVVPMAAGLFSSMALFR